MLRSAMLFSMDSLDVSPVIREMWGRCYQSIRVANSSLTWLDSDDTPDDGTGLL